MKLILDFGSLLGGHIFVAHSIDRWKASSTLKLIQRDMGTNVFVLVIPRRLVVPSLFLSYILSVSFPLS